MCCLQLVAAGSHTVGGRVKETWQEIQISEFYGPETTIELTSESVAESSFFV